MQGAVAVVRLCRPAKRNALNDALIEALRDVFQNLTAQAKAAVIHGEGDHFCAGLDLSEVSERNVFEGMQHSRSWHACFDAIQFGTVPVIAVLHGATVGGGLELASSAHLRVAEDSSFYGLPEGTRGIFVGGGGSVRGYAYQSIGPRDARGEAAHERAKHDAAALARRGFVLAGLGFLAACATSPSREAGSALPGEPAEVPDGPWTSGDLGPKRYAQPVSPIKSPNSAPHRPASERPSSAMAKGKVVGPEAKPKDLSSASIPST
jgi:hypothetical protein